MTNGMLMPTAKYHPLSIAIFLITSYLLVLRTLYKSAEDTREMRRLLG
jgi:hypothetical protein